LLLHLHLLLLLLHLHLLGLGLLHRGLVKRARPVAAINGSLDGTQLDHVVVRLVLLAKVVANVHLHRTHNGTRASGKRARMAWRGRSL
jgi:hypothetical protein